MFLAFYNKENIGDTLLLVNQETTEKIAYESVGNVTRIYNENTNETVAYNIFDVSSLFAINGNGQVFLTQAQVEKINVILKQNDFESITVDNTPKFVIGHVDTCVAHPDSDHLHITTVNVGEDVPLQIVCGASNVSTGQLVVVAKVGAVMPNGQMIWAGQLRGVDSFGMLCSKKELGLPVQPNEKGILVLEKGRIGEAFFK